MKSRLLIVAGLSIALETAIAFAQAGSSLGPKDGLDLAPTDLERVGVGSVAPDFTLESREGKTVTLSEYRGEKNVVLVFYRGHW